MNEADHGNPESRVLVLAPTGRDATNSKALLGKAGLACTLCRDLPELCREIEAGVGSVLLTEEALTLDRGRCLVEVLLRQPPWSDLPIVLLTHGGPESRAALGAMQTLGNVLLLERPVRMLTLVTALRAALRARARQYETREHLAGLRAADRRKDEFLAMLAHELRNPLAPVRNALRIMQMPNAPPNVLAQARELTERQIGQMSRLVDDLLEVSRVSRGKIELKKETVDLAAVLTRAVEAALPAVNARRHELKLALPRHAVLLDADPARLEQVFVNLLTNAAKFTPHGGRIEVTAEHEGDRAVVRVRDTGVGIAADLLPRIFELFVQAEQGSDRTEGGLGIGLTLVKSLVELHGGSIVARSAGPDQGSEFHISLPGVVSEAASAGQRAASAEPLRVPPQRILVVDDSKDAAESLALLLQLQGHQVRTANSGGEALPVAETLQPNVVFLDIGLPGMDGYEVARRMRGQPSGGRMLLVAVTGYGQDEDRRRSREAGFDHHLVKPADLAAVERILADVPLARSPMAKE
jgi:signal transduction histidine kinase/ActR/RegA family two-component response regulator